MRTLTFLPMTILFTILGSSVLHADTLKIQSVAETSGKESQGARPQRGMSMHQVREKFGKPDEELEPVGKNTTRKLNHAITRWMYKDYIVIFAENHVVDTVNKGKHVVDKVSK